MRKELKDNRCGLGSVSFIQRIIEIEKIEIKPDSKNKLLTPMYETMLVLKALPDIKPTLFITPTSPIASPRLSEGTISAMYATVPVGIKPVLIPCMNRRRRKPKTLLNSGYKKETITQTNPPKIITGLLPIKSANLPLIGRDNPAEMVNKPIVNPL